MKNFIKKKYPQIYKILVNFGERFMSFSRKSYSQFGEDLVLSTFLNSDGIKKGFYVDVGAYKPKKYSNTYFYYKAGWSGINLDARPGSMKNFQKERKRDINLEIGISKEEKDIDFYIFNEPAFNTFSKELADSRIVNKIAFDRNIKITTKRLGTVLDKYMSKDQKINFLSIDVEGFDFEVLESNDWNKYIPNYILIEMHYFNMEYLKESAIYRFLINKGYKLVSVVYITLIFKYEK